MRWIKSSSIHPTRDPLSNSDLQYSTPTVSVSAPRNTTDTTTNFCFLQAVCHEPLVFHSPVPPFVCRKMSCMRLRGTSAVHDTSRRARAPTFKVRLFSPTSSHSVRVGYQSSNEGGYPARRTTGCPVEQKARVESMKT